MIKKILALVVLLPFIFLISSVTAHYADEFSISGMGLKDGSRISHYLIDELPTQPTCRTDGCTVRTVSAESGAVSRQEVISLIAKLQDPGPASFAKPPGLDIAVLAESGQSDPTYEARVQERQKLLDQAGAQEQEWATKMLTHYQPKLIVPTSDLGDLKVGDHAALLFNPADISQLFVQTLAAHEHLISSIAAIEPLGPADPQVGSAAGAWSRVTLAIQPVGSYPLWMEARESFLKEHSPSTALFPPQAGLIAWRETGQPGARPADAPERQFAAVVPEAALDASCADTQASSMSCVWVLRNHFAVPVQVEIVRRGHGKAYLFERPVFLGRAVAARHWRELSALQRRMVSEQPRLLSATTQLALPGPNPKMSSGMAARAATESP